MTELPKEYLSNIYEKYRGNVPAKLFSEYAARTALLVDLDEQNEQQKTFVKDFVKTAAKIEIDKSMLKEGIKKIDLELINLPKSNEETTIRMNQLVLKPEVFDGEKPKPRRWIQDYNEAIVANGWSSDTAVKYLPTFLAGAAKAWYFVDIKPLLTSETKWYHVYEAFMENYLSVADFEQLSRAVENATQRPNESVSNFIPRMRRLLLLLIPDLSEQEQLRRLKEKLRPEYRQLLAYNNPSTIVQLKTCCLKIEAGFALRKVDGRFELDGDPLHKNVSPRRHYEKSQGQLANRPATSAAVRGSAQTRAARPGLTKFSPKAYPAKAVSDVKGITCYNCGKTGHMARDCWSKKQTQPKAVEYRRDGQLNLVADSPGYEESSPQVLTIRHDPKTTAKPRYTVTEKSSESLNLVVGGGELLRQKLVCNDVEINAIVDTGAYVTVIDEDIVEQCKWSLSGPSVPLVGADGQALTSKGSVLLTVEMRLGNLSKKKTHRVTVVRHLTAPMLIGLELMRDFQVCIDTANSKLKFLKQGTEGGIRLKRDEVVPPRSQTVLAAAINTVGTVMLVPFKFENGISIANSINEIHNNSTPVVVLNPFDKAVELKKGTQLASAEAYLDETLDQVNENTQVQVVNQLIQVEKLQDDICVGDDLTDEQVAQLKTLLTDYVQAFSLNGEIGKTNVQTHGIELMPGTIPFAEPLRRRAPVQIEETRKQIKELLKEGIIEESSSPWASAYVLAKKKNGEFRLCIDFRRLNEMTKKVVYPLPNIDECLETLSGKRFFSQLDFKSGFWQIAMEEQSKEYTAFRTEDGLYQFKRMPFGLTNAPATFQRLINTVLTGLKGMNLQVFIDDICIATKTWSEHLSMIKQTLEVVIKANLKIKAEKCVFGAKSVKFLGHEISTDGIRQDPEKLSALLKLPEPTETKEVKRALGMFSYYRKFVEGFAMLAEPLTKLTRKGVSFVWNDEQRQAFKSILEQLGNNATLSHFNHRDPLRLKTDASRKGVAGLLLQKQGPDWKIITCCSRRLTNSEENYGITDLEGLALVYSVTKLRPYLLGKPFQILVDHCALCVLNKRTPNSARLRRWAIVLSEFDFKIEYTKGNLHCDIDCLSRAPVDESVDSFLDNKVYIVRPSDELEWALSYQDDESRDLFQQAYDNENGLKIVNDIVYKGDLLYVPTSKRNEIIYATHSAHMNAHPGIAATTSKLKENYWWPSLRNDVTTFVNQCMACARQKHERLKPVGEMHSFEIYQPGEQVAIDLIEKITTSLNGNEFVVVAIDMFSRFVDAKAIPDKSAPTLTQFLVEYCGRFGVPGSILTDNSTTFCNEFTKQVLKVFGCAHFRSTPYHSQGNAIVERVNQTLEEKIRLILDDDLNERNWDSVLPVAVLAINTTHHVSIGCTPYELTFGKRPPLQDKQLTFKASPTDTYAKLIQKNIKECHATAVAIQAASQERAKQYFDNNHRKALYEMGDSVLIKSPPRSSKLSPRFIGDFKIVGIDKEIFTLEDIKSHKLIKRHVSDLKFRQQNQAPMTNNDVNKVSLMDKAKGRPIPSRRCILRTAFVLILALTLNQAAEGSLVFDKIEPVVWLKTKSSVILGVSEYDVNFAYTNPCHIFRKTVEGSLDTNQNLTGYQSQSIHVFEKQCRALYMLEWEHEVKQLLSTQLPSGTMEPRSRTIRPSEGEQLLRQKRHTNNVTLVNFHEIVEEPDRPWWTVSRTLRYLVLGSFGTLLNTPPQRLKLQRQLTKLVAIRNYLEQTPNLELLTERLANQTGIQVPEKLVVIPREFHWWEIGLLGLCPICMPLISDAAEERTYKSKIELVTKEIEVYLSKSSVELFIERTTEKGRTKRTSQYIVDVLTWWAFSGDFTLTPPTELNWFSKIKSEIRSRELAYLKALKNAAETGKDLDLYLLKLINSLTRLPIDDTPIEPIKVHISLWEELWTSFCHACYDRMMSDKIENEFNRQADQIINDLGQILGKPLDEEILQSRLLPSNMHRYSNDTIGRLFQETSINLYLENLFRSKSELETATRTKRDLVGTIVSETFKQTLGVISGNIVSNLVSTVVELILPNSNRNRIRRMEEAYSEMKESIEITREFDRGILENVDKLSNVVQSIKQLVDEHSKAIPQFTWLSSLIVTKMAQSSLDLQRVGNAASRGRLAVESFVRLTGLTGLRDVDPRDTKFLSISRINDHAINLKFVAVIKSPDTAVLETGTFNHFDNLDETPRYVKYTGARFLVFNQSSNCIKALTREPSEYVSDQCSEVNGNDPALNQWETLAETENIEKYANSSDVIPTLQFNYIYCFPGEIEIEHAKYKCPLTAFRLPSSKQFKTAKQQYIPTRRISNASLPEIGLDVVHAGHFRDDSDTVQHLALFESLRAERRKLNQTNERLKSSIVIASDSPWPYILITFYVTTIGFAIGYILCLRSLGAKRSSERLRQTTSSRLKAEHEAESAIKLLQLARGGNPLFSN